MKYVFNGITASGIQKESRCTNPAITLLLDPCLSGKKEHALFVGEQLVGEQRPLALVTGASSGIGFSLAKELARRDYDLVVCSAGERLHDAVRTLQSTGVRVFEIQADLTTWEGVQRLWNEVIGLAQDIKIACINAGVGVGGVFAETDLDAELNMVSLNCAGTIQIAKYVVQQMTRRNRGRILFTASIAGEMVAPGEAVYAATKAFVLSLAHSIRYELRDTNVFVTALQLGPTDTDFFHRAGMDNTKVGSGGKSESQPDDVARQGIEALLAGTIMCMQPQ